MLEGAELGIGLAELDADIPSRLKIFGGLDEVTSLKIITAIGSPMNNAITETAKIYLVRSFIFTILKIKKMNRRQKDM